MASPWPFKQNTGLPHPDAFGFGPIVELASGKLLITLNPIFSTQVGENRNQDGFGFDYGWRAEYDFAKHWGVGVEMFGQMEDLSHAGSFNDQNHSIGPTLFWKPVGGELELSFNVGVQFGLTDATSDGALKFQGTFSW
jgi:hypothetical protein